MVSIVDIIQRFCMVSVVGFLMVSVVAGICFMVAVVGNDKGNLSEHDYKETPCQRAMVKDGCLMVSVVAGKRFFMASALAAASEIIFDSSQVRDCAGDTRARSDSDIVMRSPAAKNPDLTSGRVQSRACAFSR